MSSARQSNEEVIFNTARKIDSIEARQEYLTQVYAGDVALMERVEDLLRSQADESQFLESPAVEITQQWNEVSEQPGEQIGRYKILQRIGEGGFGVVYMAEQDKPIRRKVALKVIKAGMDTREVVARFEAERQALALMDHPNIAKVLDGGATRNGRPYFVMELVKGVPLTQFCDENKLDTSRRLKLFQSVCKAIQHAHQKGIIHRDIKPSNVMVTLHDGEPIVKVIDFGVSKAISQQLTEKTLFTAYGQMIGTPQYMSPEQAEMSGLDIDTRSDIYSLGVLLYELLTGSTPIQPERLRETGFAEMQRMIREEEPPRPSMRLSTLGDQSAKIAVARGSEAKKLGDFLRGELDWVVMKALEKNRERRYETANGLAKDVQRFLDGDAVSACPPSFAYRFKKFSNKHRGVLVSAGTVVTVLTLATILSTLFAIRAYKAEREANQNLTDLREARSKEALENAFDQFLRGNVEESRRSLDVAREQNANPAKIALCEAALEHYSGRFDYEKQLDVVLAQKENIPDSMAAKILLANYYLSTLRLAEFNELKGQIKQMAPLSPIEYLMAGQFFVGLDSDLAEKYLVELGKTHNSRLVYYELSRVYASRVRETFDYSNIKKFVKFAGVAFQTMPENELACRRYVWAHLAAADYHGLSRKTELEQYHLSEAKSAAEKFENDFPQSAFAHQTKVSVHMYEEEWEKAINHSLKVNRFLDRNDGYSNSVALMIGQGKVPTLNKRVINLLPGGDLWRTLIDVHSEQGPTAARESLHQWESSNDERSLNDIEIGMLFEIKCLLGQPDAAVLTADRHVDASETTLDSLAFRNHLFDFLAARITKEELFSSAKTRDEFILCHTFAGILRLGKGNRTEAIREFEQIEKKGKLAWGNHPAGFPPRGLAYLHRLRKDPNWPSWIPVADSGQENSVDFDD